MLFDSQIQQEHNRVVIMVSKRPTRTQPIYAVNSRKLRCTLSVCCLYFICFGTLRRKVTNNSLFLPRTNIPIPRTEVVNNSLFRVSKILI